MKFCDFCHRILTRYIETGDVVFKCACGRKIDGDDKDTLIDEEYTTSDDTQLKYEVFIKNSAHDPVNFIEKRDCKNCKKDYMKMIRVGENRNVLYTCDCGYSESN